MKLQALLISLAFAGRLFAGDVEAEVDCVEFLGIEVEVDVADVHDASDEQISEAIDQGLKDLELTDKERESAMVQNSINGEKKKIAGHKSRAVTIIVLLLRGKCLVKIAITLMPTDIPPGEAAVTKAHEEGHRAIDEASTTAVNKKIEEEKKKGKQKNVKITKKGVINALAKYENWGNEAFHILFGDTVDDAKKKQGNKTPEQHRDDSAAKSEEGAEKEVSGLKDLKGNK